MTSEDAIKDAFGKAKQDISELRDYIYSLYNELDEIKRTLNELQQTNKQIIRQTNQQNNSTDQGVLPTDKLNELNKQAQYALKDPFSSFSTGNEGVPTDRQTNQQTDRHVDFSHKNQFSTPQITQNPTNSQINTNFKIQTDKPTDTLSRIDQISNAISSLDSVKKDLRVQFKHLTAQEMLVFSTIYQLQEEGFTVDYPLIAGKLNLSESSIRDYTLKITKKGIPITKNKLNNKKIILSIPENLKKIASLQTILALREL